MKPIEDKNQPKKTSLFKKEYLLALVICIVVVLFFFLSNLGESKLFKTSDQSTVDYGASLENRLKNILSDVDGVGKVNVFVSIDGSDSEVVLKEKEEKIENGVKTYSETVVLVGGKPYVISTQNPKVVGICVVCEGADNLSVKMQITEIISTTLKLDATCVRIIKMK